MLNLAVPSVLAVLLLRKVSEMRLWPVLQKKKVAVETTDQAGELRTLDREHASRKRALETAGLTDEHRKLILVPEKKL